MPSNAESFVDSYVTSLESYWNREREETKALLVKEEGNRAAYISSLEQSIRAADDDIRNWTNLQGTADRAERKLILDRQRLNISRTKARRRGLRSASVAGEAFDKLEGKFAKAATGKGEKGINLSQAMSNMGSGSKQEQALALMDILSNETDLAGLIASSGTGALGSAGIESSVAAGSGIMRTLEERNTRGAGLGVDREVLQLAAAGMVGLWGANVPDQHQLLDPAMAKQLRGAVTQRANAAVSTASSGAEDKALADELERSGFLLEDFLPAMEASGLIQRREDLDRRLAEERAARQPDLEAETERRFLERVGTGGAGEGLEFAGRGILGAFQFAAQEKRERRALDERRASLTARQGELDAMTPNSRLLQRTTGLAMGSYQKHGNNIPPGVSKELWELATQVANQSKSGGFSSRDDIVVQTRALVNQLKSLDGVSPEERENALEQTLEFFGMQKMGDYPPPAPPVERVVDEVEAAVEAADPDKKRGGAAAAAKDAAAAKAAREKAAREEAARADARKKARAARDAKEKAARGQGLSQRDVTLLSRLAAKLAWEFLDLPTTMREKWLSPNYDASHQKKRLDKLSKKNTERSQALSRSGVSPSLIKSVALKMQNMTPPEGMEGGVAGRATRIQAYSIALDMLEQQQGTGTISLPRYLQDNPKLSIDIIGEDGAGQAATLAAAQGIPGPLAGAGLSVVDRLLPNSLRNQGETFIDSSFTSEDEWDSVLDQMVAAEGAAEDQEKSDASLQEALEGF